MMRLTKADSWEYFSRLFTFLLMIALVLSLLYMFAIIMPTITHGSPMTASADFNLAILYVHIIAAVPPFFLGIFLFTSVHPQKNAARHRTIGTVYCISIWISAPTGVMLATANGYGIVSQLGFGTLGVLWFTTTTFAYLRARQKNYLAHRHWMIRSYALTLAFVTVRPLFLFGPPEFVTQQGWVWNPIVSWACWVPNLLLGELYARATLYSGKLKKARAAPESKPL